jgi:hypothetical protein
LKAGTRDYCPEVIGYGSIPALGGVIDPTTARASLKTLCCPPPVIMNQAGEDGEERGRGQLIPAFDTVTAALLIAMYRRRRSPSNEDHLN